LAEKDFAPERNVCTVEHVLDEVLVELRSCFAPKSDPEVDGFGDFPDRVQTDDLVTGQVDDLSPIRSPR